MDYRKAAEIMKTVKEFWTVDYARRRRKYNEYPADVREAAEQSAVENERIFSEVLQLLRDLRDGNLITTEIGHMKKDTAYYAERSKKTKIARKRNI